MKRFFAFAVVAAFLAVAAVSCKSSAGGHCDAYGSTTQVENSDLAAK